ncbi:hypothetical protein PR048_006853 [Dryococelus australis]|uniref:Uncharacterized protein n=1 Tax=Dryococelus australis TaxID=614101 RepID=A0ABQ9IC66_9NEOP|nr:hypothetical protein PR048_006853 [Dryococelus australis]
MGVYGGVFYDRPLGFCNRHLRGHRPFARMFVHNNPLTCCRRYHITAVLHFHSLARDAKQRAPGELPQLPCRDQNSKGGWQGWQACRYPPEHGRVDIDFGDMRRLAHHVSALRYGLVHKFVQLSPPALSEAFQFSPFWDFNREVKCRGGSFDVDLFTHSLAPRGYGTGLVPDWLLRTVEGSLLAGLPAVLRLGGSPVGFSEINWDCSKPLQASVVRGVPQRASLAARARAAVLVAAAASTAVLPTKLIIPRTPAMHTARLGFDWQHWREVQREGGVLPQNFAAVPDNGDEIVALLGCLLAKFTDRDRRGRAIKLAIVLGGRGSAATRGLASHQGEPSSISGVVASVGIVSDDAAAQRVFSGISCPPSSPAVRRCSIPRPSHFGSQDPDVASHPNLSTPLDSLLRTARTKSDLAAAFHAQDDVATEKRTPRLLRLAKTPACCDARRRRTLRSAPTGRQPNDLSSVARVLHIKGRTSPEDARGNPREVTVPAFKGAHSEKETVTYPKLAEVRRHGDDMNERKHCKQELFGQARTGKDSALASMKENLLSMRAWMHMERRRNWGRGRGKREIPEKTHRPAASSGTIPTCESPVTRPGIEPGFALMEGERAIRSATAAPLSSMVDETELCAVTRKNVPFGARTERQASKMEATLPSETTDMQDRLSHSSRRPKMAAVNDNSNQETVRLLYQPENAKHDGRVLNASRLHAATRKHCDGLSDFDKGVIVVCHLSGLSSRAIAGKVNRPKSKVAFVLRKLEGRWALCQCCTFWATSNLDRQKSQNLETSYLQQQEYRFPLEHCVQRRADLDISEEQLHISPISRQAIKLGDPDGVWTFATGHWSSENRFCGVMSRGLHYSGPIDVYGCGVYPGNGF